MSFTRVLGPGIHTASNINSHNINSTGIITAVSFVGDGSSLTGVANTDYIVGTAITMGTGNFTGNLTVGGVLTYEDVKNVDSIGVVTARNGIDCNGDIDVDGHSNLDNVSIAGVTTFSNDVYFDGATADRDIIFDRSANTLQVKRNAILKIGQGSYSTDLYTDGTNTFFDHNQNSALFVKSNIFQVFGTGNGYDGTIFRCMNGKVELGYEVSNGGATTLNNLVTTPIGVTVGTGVTIESNGNSNFVGVSSIGTGHTGAVYLYNPADDELSATTNDDYGWKAKTYKDGLQVNSKLYLSRSGSNGLQLTYNNATGSYITAQSGFLRVGVPYGGYFNLYSNQIWLKDRLQTTTFALFEKVSNSLWRSSLYSNNQVKLNIEPSGISVVGTTTTTQLAVTGVSTFTGNSNFNGDVFLLGASSKTITFDQSEGHIRWLDNAKAQFGTQGDLEIYHNGSHAFIENTGDGYLFLNNTNANIYLRPNSGEDGIIVKTNSAVELYHNNTKRIETTSGGANVIGNFVADCSNSIDPDSYTSHFITGGIQDGSGWSANGIAFGAGTGHMAAMGSNGSRLYMAYGNGSANGLKTFLDIGTNGELHLNYQDSQKLRTTSSGVSITGSLTVTDDIYLSDANVAYFGTNNDMRIYHSGTHGYIKNTVGNLYFMTTNSEYGALLYANGGAELRYDNVKKFETTSYGAFVTGQLVANNGLKVNDGNHITLGTDNDLRLYFDGSNAAWNNQVGNSYFYGGGGDFYIRPVNAEQALNILANGSVELFHDNTKMAYTSSSGFDVTNGDLRSHLNIKVLNDNQKLLCGAGNDLQLYHDGVASVIKNITGDLYVQSIGDVKIRTLDTELAINCEVNGAVELYHNGNRQVFTIDGGMNWQDNKKAEFGNSGDLKIYHSSGINYIDATAGNFALRGTGNDNVIYYTSNGDVEIYDNGSKKLETSSSGITVTGTVDSASDVILKENIKTIDNALDKVTKLRGVEYDYKENKKHSIGVIAQEVEEVLPELVNGTEQKSVAYGNIAAVLIEAIKEQNEIINKMKKEIEDLKG